MLFGKIKDYNQAPLEINTFDGYNSPYHPSVLYFENGWNGWKYWMVETPYYKHCEPYRDRNECPSIHVSNDGVNWTEPVGLINPLVNFSETGEKNLDYYSDPHLLIGADGYMECWYRLTEREGNPKFFDKVSLRRVRSKDGVNWSSEEVISQLNLNDGTKGLGKVIVSPAVIYENGKYRIWYVDSETGNSFNSKEPRDIAYSESTDLKIWTTKEICPLKGNECNPWHIDVAKIDEKYYLTVYGDKILTIFESNDGFTYNFIKVLLTPAPVLGAFYTFGLYRACLINAENIFKLYFSADDGFCTHIGLMEGPSVEDLKISNVNNKSFQNTFTYLIFHMKRVRFIINHIFKS